MQRFSTLRRALNKMHGFTLLKERRQRRRALRVDVSMPPPLDVTLRFREQALPRCAALQARVLPKSQKMTSLQRAARCAEEVR